MLAFHEAFADIVALFQHFTVYEIVRSQLARTRGHLDAENLLGQLAMQFGMALYGKGALRDYLAQEPHRTDYQSSQEPHSRGAVLVAAVFDAFLRIYGIRYDRLARLATGGSGVVSPGELPAPLLDALAKEATDLAAEWLEICIRALDYCPPVDIEFADYLRALVTADTDNAPDDERSYRVAFVGAFRDRGIVPSDIRNASVNTLVWEPPPVLLGPLNTIVEKLSLSWNLHADRAVSFKRSRDNALLVHDWLLSKAVSEDEITALGLVRLPAGTRRPEALGGLSGTLHGIEVHSVSPARRMGADGQSRIDLVIEITQGWHPDDTTLPIHRGGVTLLVDLETNAARYFIRKRIASADRYGDQLQFADSLARSSLAGNYFACGTEPEPFAALHRLPDLLAGES